MKIIEAALELRKLFPGKHTTIDIRVVNYSHSDVPEIEIQGYHEDLNHTVDAKNFEDVIAQLVAQQVAAHSVPAEVVEPVEALPFDESMPF